MLRALNLFEVLLTLIKLCGIVHFDFIISCELIGFPFQIGQPEDWNQAPDPKKHFVQFYGTGEM